MQETLIVACRFCGTLPDINIKKGDNKDKMYYFEINHKCINGFTQSHLSLFYKNESSHENCIKTLNDCITTYSNNWNKMHDLTTTQPRDGL